MGEGGEGREKEWVWFETGQVGELGRDRVRLEVFDRIS